MLNQNAKVRVAGVAARQFGRVSWAQFVALGVDKRTIHDWLQSGYLHRVLPRVYAVGHCARTTESDLIAAVLYAGPGAALSHATAAWWVGLADSRPYMIDVSTPRRCRSLPGIRVHRRRSIGREWHEGLPVTPFPQTMRDYASRASLSKVRRALARADFQGGLNVAALQAGLGAGRAGSARLRAALRRHQPQLANAHSWVEVRLFELCEAGDLPLPELNADIAGWEVDALWRRQRVAVEIDGPGNHRSPAQMRRDRLKDFELRAAQIVVLRYSDDQVDHHESAVITEIREALSRTAPSA
jgi:very-short-patch-repair endonuclease